MLSRKLVSIVTILFKHLPLIVFPRVGIMYSIYTSSYTLVIDWLIYELIIIFSFQTWEDRIIENKWIIEKFMKNPFKIDILIYSTRLDFIRIHCPISSAG